MAENNTLKSYSIRLRNDTLQNWTSTNPILAKGEVGIEFPSDETVDSQRVKIKIGDGVRSYNNLEYFNDPISYNNLINKPVLNHIEISGDKKLSDYGIQPLGDYVTSTDLSLKADADNTYSKADIDLILTNMLNDLVLVPKIDSNINKYLKIDNAGKLYWASLSEDLYTKTDIDEKLINKVDKESGKGLISTDEAIRLSNVYNYNDSEIKEDINELKTEVINKIDEEKVINEYVSKNQLDETLENYSTLAQWSTKADLDDFTSHIMNKHNPHNVTKELIDLNNVDNTSDLDKPISKLTQEALDLKQDALKLNFGLAWDEDGGLINTVPNVNADWEATSGDSLIINKPILSSVALSGSYNDLNDKPYIPMDYELPVASSEILGGIKIGDDFDIDDNGVLELKIPETLRDYNNLVNKPSFKVLKEDGSNVMEDKPLIYGATLADYDIASDKETKSELVLKAYIKDVYTKDVIDEKLDGVKAGASSWGKITGALFKQEDLYSELNLRALDSDLATVAKSGSYNDLSGTPNIDDIVNGILTTGQYQTKADLNDLDETVVHKTGNETITGTKTFTNTIIKKDTTYSSSTAPSTVGYPSLVDFKDKNNDTTGFIGQVFFADGGIRTRLGASRKKTNGTYSYGEIGIQSDSSGNMKTYAPTPASNDNSTQIATTAWVLNKIVELTQTQIATTIMNKIYPVGSIYTSVNNTNPSSLFGGTWQSIGSGRVLQGVGSGQTAGKTVEAGLPNIKGTFGGVGRYADQWNPTGSFYFENGSTVNNGDDWGGSPNMGFDASRYNSIYGKSNTVQPPAYLVYFWRRTA